ncbi:MAG TPA: diguanylate cyclase [Dokdonella sp.]|uniref:diguanylate cyclase domain-containing protein n=1 Tax=Dokdonella sp. TaxID=2291710 RepID=UPI002D7E3F3D|nr:diguanylate cyclase [Dokdonella sp.]HET9032575.1 diguanylate cyclase [Dokdonella sp.]
MKPRFGLQVRFLTLVGIALLVSIVTLAIVLQRQWSMRKEVLELSRHSIQTLVLDRLRDQAKAVGANTAEALVNPLYTFDLEKIGRIVRDVLVQPDVNYVIVYDSSGAIIHDGSDGIASYGQVMTDPLAAPVIKADGLLIQQEGDVFDVSAPVRIGDQRLGGVRIGYSLKSVRRYEDQASAQLADHLAEIGWRYLIAAVILMLLALALGIVISIVMQHSLIRPIRRLAQAAREVEAGNLATNFPERDNNDEVGELVRAFERMTEGIARRDRNIRHIANSDALTGLANRRAFRENLERAIAQSDGAEFALILADIDDFKPINDTWGHDAGDKLLCRFAGRLREVVNSIDELETKPARLGGDEFILIVRLVDDAAAPLRDVLDRLGRNLVAEFSRSTVIDGRTHQFSASFGMAIFPDHGRNAAQLMKAADVAMYSAKNAGKNRYHFHPDS